MTPDVELKNVNCPYCNAVNFITSAGISLSFPYPTINPANKFLGTITYSLVPAGTQEEDIRCINCGNIFSVFLFRRNPDDPIYDCQVKKYFDSLVERKQIEEKIPLFEKFIKWYFAHYDIFEIKSRLFAAYILILATLAIFLSSQFLLQGSLSITFEDYPFLVFFVLYGLLVYLFSIYIDQYHFSLNATDLPLMLSDEYRKSSYFKVFEEWRINFFNYAYHKIPFTRYSISHPSFSGLLTAVFYLTFVIILIFTVPKSLIQTGLPDNNLILSLAYLPFWVFFSFIFFYIFAMLLHTSGFLVHMSENTPFIFNPLKKNAGFDSLMKLWSLIILQISIMGSLLIVLFYDLWRMNIVQINIEAMLRESWGIVLGLILVILLMWFFIVPLIALTKKYQKLKYEYLEKIRKQIESSNMCSSYENEKEDTTLLRFKFDKANSLPDWPLPVRINILLSLVIPLLSLLGPTIIKILTNK
jgi:hypothetical protein